MEFAQDPVRCAAEGIISMFVEFLVSYKRPRLTDTQPVVPYYVEQVENMRRHDVRILVVDWKSLDDADMTDLQEIIEEHYLSYVEN